MRRYSTPTLSTTIMAGRLLFTTPLLSRTSLVWRRCTPYFRSMGIGITTALITVPTVSMGLAFATPGKELDTKATAITTAKTNKTVGKSPAPSNTPPFDYAEVRKALEDLFDDNLSLAPMAIRLAWHAAGAWDGTTKDGGSNTASMRFDKEGLLGANNGLKKIRDSLEPIKALSDKSGKENPNAANGKGISYADLWVLAAFTAISVMNGPDIPFKWGRIDAKDDTAASPDGRLPNAALTQNHVRCVFGRMGFNDEETTALIGAHAVGECHREHSGYVGPWTFEKYGFGNQFYTTLLENEWVVNPKEPVLQFTDLATKSLLMLPGDIAFLIDPKYRTYVETFAKDPDLWAKKFTDAFVKMMDFNTANLRPIS